MVYKKSSGSSISEKASVFLVSSFFLLGYAIKQMVLVYANLKLSETDLLGAIKWFSKLKYVLTKICTWVFY